MSTNTLYYLAVGGTGALSVEPLLALCAAGLGPARLAVMLIDADAANPAVARARELTRQYALVREAFGNPEQGFFRTALIRTAPAESVWSPLGSGSTDDVGQVTLERFTERQRMTGDCADAATLLDLLFSPGQQKEPLREGFRGNPSIGSILMHGIRESEFFRQFMSSARGDTSAAFFVAGSIFGGTGASALPVLAKVLAAEGIQRAALGAALVTPYYSLEEPGQGERQDGRLKPNSEVFLRNTAAALPTYVRGHSEYGALYVIGDDQSLPRPRPLYSAGGAGQKNDPHVVELYAALAALDFAQRPHEPGAPTRVRYSTVAGQQPTWSDLPLGTEERRDLQAFLVAANFFLQYFGPTRSGAEQQAIIDELRSQAWVHEIALAPEFVRTQSAALDALGRYFGSVWGYLRAVSENYVPVRLVTFEGASGRAIRTPDEYARSGGDNPETEFRLPPVDKCLAGFAPRQKPKRLGIFGKGGEDQLASLAEIFSWYNRARVPKGAGLPGLLRYMEAGTRLFVTEWYATT
ncbi:MAG TPA: hypothetical protein VF647_11800 [Longimicrobium sp.]|jgi:hypothetical protein